MDGCHFSYITKLKGKKTRKKKRKEKEHLLELKCKTLFWMKKTKPLVFTLCCSNFHVYGFFDGKMTKTLYWMQYVGNRG
jgi:hypothetical protein